MPKARVLAVDDQLYFRVFLEDLLVQEGYEVETVSSGAEALHVLERERFDVLLVDMMMPGMSGTELVGAVKARDPEQPVVVVTSVADVRVAVEAMKVGAEDYLLKPIDRADLARSLETLLQRRRLRNEHARLVQENLEFLDALAFYERARSLFATLVPEPLADRIVEAFCVATRSQTGVVWVARDDDPARLRLLGARGLVRVEQEPEEIAVADLAGALFALARGGRRSGLIDPGEAAPGAALWVALREGGDLLGLLRLTDRLEGAAFGDRERAVAEKYAELAEVALRNALKFRALERRSFRHPVTKAYTPAFLEDAVHHEIRKANRFGRSFALVRVELQELADTRRRLGNEGFARFVEALVLELMRSLRATDLLAAEDEGRFTFFLPETETLGALILKRRVVALLEETPAMRDLPATARPLVLSACASFPADGRQLEALHAALDQRTQDDRRSPVRRLAAESRGFAAFLEVLLERAEPAPPGMGSQVMRFVLEEVSRRPWERALVFCAPGEALVPAARQGLEGLRGVPVRSHVVVVNEDLAGQLPGVPVTWVPAARLGATAPFVVHLGEGPAYAWAQGPSSEGEAAAIFHTRDRGLVEHLAFELGRELGIPLGH